MEWNNFRLGTNSPCVDAGSAALVTNDLPADLDGLPRIAGAQIDMGAYEVQTGTRSGVSAPASGEADSPGPDPAAETSPHPVPDVTIRSIQVDSSTMATSADAPRFGAQIGWEALPDRSYSLLRSTNLLEGFQPARTIESGAGGSLVWDIEEPPPPPPAVFYRILTGPDSE